MGNKNSTEDDNKLKAKTSAQLVDYLATHYITSASFKALKKLNEKEYCDRMVILTTDLLNKYFNALDVKELDNRVKNGADKIYFLPEEELHHLNNSDTKYDTCKNIARFYITVAHVFAAIMTTMNPRIEYIDPYTQQSHQLSILEKDQVPQGVAYEIIHKTSLCDRRIQALKRGHGDVSSDPSQDTVNVHPQVCDINRRGDGEDMRLDDEPGIPEFVQLYYDKYNPETGEFDDMTNETRKIFEDDLRIFYEVFTGRGDMPNTVTKFSDIKLRDYHSLPKCQGAAPPLDKHVRGSVSQKLFKQYADNLTEMINNATKNQEALTNLLTIMFGYVVEPDGTKQVRLSADLTEDKLQEIVLECRKGIIKLILQCEIDFTNGVKIYEAIIESKLFETVQSQIQNLDAFDNEPQEKENLEIDEPMAPISVENAIAPVENAIAPVENAIAPVENAIAPVENAIAPVENAIAPVENAIAPVENAIAPVENAIAPVENAIAPVENAIALPQQEVTSTVDNIANPQFPEHVVTPYGKT